MQEADFLNVSSYEPQAGSFDEMASGPHWQPVLDHFLSHEAHPRLSPEQLRHEMSVRDLDIVRPWALDPLPFLLAEREWQALERGLIQRTELLNRILSDLYGPRTLLQGGGLPPALVFGNPRYLLPAYDYRTEDDAFLTLAAYDLGRGPDGVWRVLADWTEAPQGLGMCLENRVLAGQALPELFQSLPVQRLSDFFNALAERLRDVAGRATTEDATTVILSPGHEDPGYFEHVYLGQYFGLPVVEGADLTTRGQSLKLKTLEGLKTVGGVWRYTQSAYSDTLYLRGRGSEGVAGLVNIAKNKQVHVSNAVGTGVLENDAFMSFLPGLCKRMLGEDLLTASIATWWCGQEDARQAVMNAPSALSFSGAFERSDLLDRANLVYQEATAVPNVLDYRTVAREPIQLSASPYLDESGQMLAGPTTLRLFVARVQDGYRLLPGGIAKVGTPIGEITKDVWIAEGVLPPVFNRPNPARGSRRSDRDLPSRTADDLFWLGRYIERCEGGARAYRSLMTRISEQGLDERRASTDTIVSLLVKLDMISAQQARAFQRLQAASDIALAPLLFSSDGHAGFAGLLTQIFNLASQVRERLSADAWRLFTALSQAPAGISQDNPQDAVRFLDRLLERLSALSGQIQENMTRSYGWRLLELGRRIERAQYGLNVIQQTVTEVDDQSHLYLLLDLCDNTITYRSRYQAIPELSSVLHLLLLDETNPRSIIYQVQSLRSLMAEMPQDQTGDGLSSSQRMLLAAYHELILADPEKLAGVISKAGNRTQLKRVISRLETTLSELSRLVSDTYFAHARDSGRAR